MGHTWAIKTPKAGGFLTTRWKVVAECQHPDPSIVKHALGEICQSYWYPIYAVIRQSGRSPEDAQDLTQEFLLKIIKGHWFRCLEQSKGRFRAYLLTSLKHFLHDQGRRWNLLRGRGYQTISIDAVQAEHAYALEPADSATPEILYERRWAALVVRHALDQLKVELEAGRRPGMFACLEKVIFAETDSTFYKASAAALCMEVGALQTAVSRLRRRLRELLREEVARTLSLDDPTEIESEMQHLVRMAVTYL